VALAGRCAEHGLFFKSPAAADLALIEEADSLRPEAAPGFQVEPGPKSNSLIAHGVLSYLDLFSSRQLLYLHAATNHLKRCQRLVKLNLGLLVSTSTEFNALLCGYKGGARRRPGAIRHAFAHHAYSFPYTALENNPLNPRRSSGTLQALFHARVRRARKWAARPVERCLQDQKVKQIVHIEGELDRGLEVGGPAHLLEGERKFMLIQGSSASLELAGDSVDHIVTDPPYFDNVQYSDLSAFFRVWLKRLLAGEAGWEIDLAISAVDPQANGDGHYGAVLGSIFKECYRVLKKKSGRLVFTFHHWNPNGWAGLTGALKEAGFILLNRYVIHSENPASVHIANLKSLAHDAVLVLAAHPAAVARSWPAPKTINVDSSEVFVGDCAAALGWMLASDLDRQGIKRLWLELLS
jgi:putative DNA methylase